MSEEEEKDTEGISGEEAPAPAPGVAPEAGMLYEADQTFNVRLLNFDGPLELLLHLIRKHKYDIYDIPIAAMLKEYLAVIESLQEFDIDLAGEFLVMAATLAQIKSRMLLPRPGVAEEGEEGADPRAELVRRLLEYERFREAADALAMRPILGREVFARAPADGPPEGVERPDTPVEADLLQLIIAFRDVLKEAPEAFVHEVSRQRMTTTEAVTELLERFEGLGPGESLAFRELFAGRPDKARLIALFMGLLELVKMKALRIRQALAFGEIRVYPTSAEEEEESRTPDLFSVVRDGDKS